MLKIKYFLFVVLFSIVSIKPNFSAQNGFITITSIQVQNKEIPKSHWSVLSFTTKDTVVFNFSINTNHVVYTKIHYQIFLNGEIINLGNPRSNSVTLSRLTQGNYIIKIKGYSDEGWETIPLVQQFVVSEFSQVNPKVKENNTTYSSFIFYGIIGFASLLIILLILIVFKRISYKEKNQKLNKKEINNTIDSNIEVKEKNVKKMNTLLNNKIDELTRNINLLKKEFKKLEEQNKALKEQVKELKSYTVNLETANIQLIDQKERLAESKLKLEELHSQKEKLFATTVHDIKNPAAAIKGYVELLDGYDLNAIEQHEIMQFLADTSGKILELAQKMSVVIATDVVKPEINFQKLSIKPVIDRVCNQNFASAKRKNIKIINNTSVDCPDVLFDEDKIFEVMDNLIGNAIKFSRENSVVQVRSYFNNKRIFVEVIDNGIGLPPSDMPKLFMKGAMLSSRPTGGEESSGLGLWIVKNIIEEHKGKIWASSKEGIGSTFTFELPIKNVEQNS
jgi:signal transduction histidine kinase